MQKQLRPQWHVLTTSCPCLCLCLCPCLCSALPLKLCFEKLSGVNDTRLRRQPDIFEGGDDVVDAAENA